MPDMRSIVEIKDEAALKFWAEMVLRCSAAPGFQKQNTIEWADYMTAEYIKRRVGVTRFAIEGDAA